jgi:hypothetical protein
MSGRRGVHTGILRGVLVDAQRPVGAEDSRASHQPTCAAWPPDMRVAHVLPLCSPHPRFEHELPRRLAPDLNRVPGREMMTR